MATTTNEGCPIRWYSPSTSQPTAIRSFSSSSFAISAIFEKPHQLLQSRPLDCRADRPAVQRLPGGPTEDFTRDGDNLHLLTTLNSPPRGRSATLFPPPRSSNHTPSLQTPPHDPHPPP